MVGYLVDWCEGEGHKSFDCLFVFERLVVFVFVLCVVRVVQLVWLVGWLSECRSFDDAGAFIEPMT